MNPDTYLNLTRDDLQYAINELNTYLDITIDDLLEVYSRARHHAQLRQIESHPLTSYINLEVFVAYPDEAILTAARRFVEHHISTLPVVDNDDRLLGVLTEADVMTLADIPHHAPGTRLHDLWEQLLGHDRQGQTGRRNLVKDFMATEPITINISATLGEACESMRRNHIKTLIVIDDQCQVKGVVSRSSILKALLDDPA